MLVFPLRFYIKGELYTAYTDDIQHSGDDIQHSADDIQHSGDDIQHNVGAMEYAVLVV